MPDFAPSFLTVSRERERMDDASSRKWAQEHPAVEKLVRRIAGDIRRCAVRQRPDIPDALIQELLDDVVVNIRGFAEHQLSHIYELVRIGLGLSAEKQLDRLLEMIVREARRFTNADGGALYIRNDEREVLDFAIVQNESMGVHMGGTGTPVTWSSVLLYLPDGSENHKNVSAHCALSGEAVNIPEVYAAEGFDFQGTRDFDASTGYRSQSMLVIPMRDHEEEIIGVLQLINARDRDTGMVEPFPEDEVEMITSLASEAAVAVTNMRLVRGLENLLNSFIQAIADAIDEKSPYTAGHILRVAAMTESLAEKINHTAQGPFAGVSFSPAEMAEIRMAAWLHDIGKITTPEFVVDKATKLETVFDRIELVRNRIEILKRDREIRRLKNLLAKNGATVDASPGEGDHRDLDEYLSFLEAVNYGGEILSEESLGRIRKIASVGLTISGRPMPLLDPDEVTNLSIRHGTLTDEERRRVGNHVNMSIRMLEGLPFPKKLRRVPLYAGLHHEKLDGSGYPHGLTADEIPLPGRIMAVADIFEALTASDRPYKRGKRLSEAMHILEQMVHDRKLDGDVCDLLVESNLVVEYARKSLSDWQIDDFEWRGKRYPVKKHQG